MKPERAWWERDASERQARRRVEIGPLGVLALRVWLEEGGRGESMSLYTSKELEREARQAFKVAVCYACAGVMSGERKTGPRRFEGWRVQIVSGDGCAVIGFGKCPNGHELSGSCAV